MRPSESETPAHDEKATVHLVPHTHWDREWYLPFQTTRVRLVHLLDRLLTLLERDSDWTHFMLDGQAILLEDYLKVRPERREELEGLVQAGRIDMGPWYVLADEFLVSPEALIRNLLIGGRICESFGGRMHLGYMPDLFGHISQMPQILLGFGFQAAVLRRGLSEEGCELCWRSPDGSQLLTLYLRDGYDNAARMPTEQEAFEAFVREKCESLRAHCRTPERLLLNGSDHHEPQGEVPRLVNQSVVTGHVLGLSSLERYACSVRSHIEQCDLELPTVDAELRDPRRHHLLSGVLSTRVRLKQRNHHCETLLERWAEPFSAFAHVFAPVQPDRSVWTGHMALPPVRKPGAFVDQAWRLLLECQPHDSICGCSVDQVHEEMQTRFAQVEQISEEIIRQSLTLLAGAINTRLAATQAAVGALVVFNPHAQRCSGVAEVDFELAAGLDPFRIVDDQGRTVPFKIRSRTSRSLADMIMTQEQLQGMLGLIHEGKAMDLAIQSVAILPLENHTLVEVVVAEEARPNFSAVRQGRKELEELMELRAGGEYRLLVRFSTHVAVDLLAHEVPGFGYKTYLLEREREREPEKPSQRGRRIENEFLALSAGPGGRLELYDKVSGKGYPGLLTFQDQGDAGDSYNFCPLPGDRPIRKPDQVQVEARAGPFGSRLVIDLSLRVPSCLAEGRKSRSRQLVSLPVRVTARLFHGVPRADLVIELENTARDHRLQVLFPTGEACEEGVYDGHFHILHRSTQIPTDTEDWIEQPSATQPMRAFVAAGVDRGGLVVAGRGLREASVSPEGEIAVTLLRAIGWLSRDDLHTRRGGAGPTLPVPGGQVPGAHRFEISLIPIGEDPLAAYQAADRFQSQMRGVGTDLHAGPLPPRGCFVELDNDALRISCLKEAEDGDGLILRGVNLLGKVIRVRGQSRFKLRSLERCRLDEERIGEIPLVDGRRFAVDVDPHQVVTLRMRPFPHFDQEVKGQPEG